VGAGGAAWDRCPLVGRVASAARVVPRCLGHASGGDRGPRRVASGSSARETHALPFRRATQGPVCSTDPASRVDPEKTNDRRSGRLVSTIANIPEGLATLLPIVPTIATPDTIATVAHTAKGRQGDGLSSRARCRNGLGGTGRL
jgi:hypothetical protein